MESLRNWTFAGGQVQVIHRPTQFSPPEFLSVWEGEIHQMSCQRVVESIQIVNFPFWPPHSGSSLLYLLGQKCLKGSATGRRDFQGGIYLSVSIIQCLQRTCANYGFNARSRWPKLPSFPPREFQTLFTQKQSMLVYFCCGCLPPSSTPKQQLSYPIPLTTAYSD